MKTKAINLEIDDINQGMKEKIEINLSWSEYYNNKWQPRKTSDFNDPIELGEFEQDKKFKRENIVISSSFDDSGLIIDIDYPAKKSHHFKLFNKHSAPLMYRPTTAYFPDSKFRKRVIDTPEDKPYIIRYENPTFEHEVLNPTEPHPYDIVETNRDVTNIFEAPFFYQDRKHVFFVKPEEGITTVPEHEDVGTYEPDLIIHDIANRPILNIPPGPYRVWVQPKRRGIIGPFPGPDPRPIDFLDESVFVDKVVSDNRVVTFGDARIGPMGSQYAPVLYNNKLKANFEMINIKGVIK